MKTFISYHSNIDRLAGRIKRYLDEYGFNCFLAHDDIKPQAEWIREIEDNLKDCDLFLPLITDDFKTSFFCQQETGYAYCSGVEILSVMISESPVGFIAENQAIRFNKKLFDNSCWKIVKHVAKIRSISKPVIRKLIKQFGESGSYDDAGTNAELILSEFKFTLAQVRSIKKYIDSNSQIYESKTAKPFILNFIESYSDHFDEEFIEKYKERFSRWSRW